tara:strand:- start:846 stop:1601 length:756 start_codon:yes stop_codon:yes gene_type:complete
VGMSKVLVTGGFDPLHRGHIALLKESKQLGTYLIVGLNSDKWLSRKKGRPFMSYEERKEILLSLSCVDEVISFNDDNDTACDAIAQVIQSSPIIFANGGDRHNENVPEYNLYKHDDNVTFRWGIGGTNKQNSSSWLLDNFNNPQTDRTWGYYKVLYEGKGYKVKELVINPHSSLSMQRHKHRSETWNLVSGNAHVIIDNEKMELSMTDSVHIPVNTWHKGVNESDEQAHIIEIWKGDRLTEYDIERRRLIM